MVKTLTKGRPREFDTTEALQKALLVFWEKGYRGASLDDLTEAMEINRPSLYAAFQDKQTLFLQVVDQYRDVYLVPRMRKLLASNNLREGLQEYFRSMSGMLTEDETPPGCLVACMLSEECCESEEIRTKLSDMISSADGAFTKLFETHQKQIKKSIEPSDAARLLTSTLHGISIRARAGATRRTLSQMCDTFLNLILRSE